jgi:hypothetical protein
MGQDTPGQGTAAQILDPETLQTSYLLLRLRILVLWLQRVLHVSGARRTISETYKRTYLNTGRGTQQNSLGTREMRATFNTCYIKRFKEILSQNHVHKRKTNFNAKASK